MTGSGKKAGPPKLYCNHKGLFSISIEAQKLIGLKDGDKVAIHMDKKDPKNWFICKVKKSDPGFEVRYPSKSVNQLIFNSTVLSQKMYHELYGREDRGKFTMLVAGTPTVLAGVKYYGLLARPIV